MKINAEESSQALKKLICNTDMQFINQFIIYNKYVINFTCEKMVVVDSRKFIHTSPPIIPTKKECGDIFIITNLIYTQNHFNTSINFGKLSQIAMSRISLYVIEGHSGMARITIISNQISKKESSRCNDRCFGSRIPGCYLKAYVISYDSNNSI